MSKHLRPQLLALLLLSVSPAVAEEPDAHVAQVGGIRVVHAWSRATDANEGTVFMEIESSSAGDRLTGASTDLAGAVAIHGAVLVDGVPSSEPLEEVEIPAGGEFVLEPEAVFLKLTELKQPLEQGEVFPLELRFAQAGALTVEVEVEAADATAHSHAGHAH